MWFLLNCNNITFQDKIYKTQSERVRSCILVVEPEWTNIVWQKYKFLNINFSPRKLMRRFACIYSATLANDAMCNRLTGLSRGGRSVPQSTRLDAVTHAICRVWSQTEEGSKWACGIPQDTTHSATRHARRPSNRPSGRTEPGPVWQSPRRLL